MSANFSVKVGRHNDFISPSQACVVSLNSLKKSSPQAFDDDGLVQIQSKKLLNPDFNQASALSKSDPVKVSLHDCLACSGCITSAETVLIEQQSTGEFLSQLDTGKKAVVVSLSPQSRASLAAYYGVTPLQAFKKFTGFMKSIGVRAVFDTSCSRDLSLIESCKEFVTRFRDNKNLPILASACPGWVCYAEKTHGADILPHISAVKSPQQAMGAIVKRFACSSLGLQPEDIYHVTVMPCYDKKLEASREDFVFSGEVNGETDGPQMTEVDCVLTTTEVLDLLATKSADFTALEEAPLDRLLANVDESEQLFGVQGGSGGYAECIFRYAASVLFGKEVIGPLKFKVLRNSDFQETSLEIGGKPVLQFACVYGFRNIQNLVRRIKSGKCEYHYVEIMACPSGCLNGGGQIKPRKGQSAKDLIQLIEVTYANDIEIRDPFSNKITQGLYDQWLGHPGSAKACEIMQTQYHSREKTVGSYISDW
ncbi:unnamed protein product [Sphagnum troendelagicum]|uniref:Iron hydrogenase small subunit domain-containing protein n=1 Tax=Sphagnum troendelagicum TaxID=128251 RepID=A0ABP0V2M4_9BRYO